MKRSAEEIKQVMKIIETIRFDNPELRFVQLLWAMNIITHDNDGFQKENDVLFANQSFLPQRDVIVIKYMLDGRMVSRRLRYIDNATLWTLIEGHKEWALRKDVKILQEELDFREKNSIFIVGGA